MDHPWYRSSHGVYVFFPCFEKYVIHIEIKGTTCETLLGKLLQHHDIVIHSFHFHAFVVFSHLGQASYSLSSWLENSKLQQIRMKLVLSAIYRDYYILSLWHTILSQQTLISIN